MVVHLWHKEKRKTGSLGHARRWRIPLTEVHSSTGSAEYGAKGVSLSICRLIALQQYLQMAEFRRYTHAYAHKK